MPKQTLRVAIGTASLIAGGIMAVAGATPASATPSHCSLTLASHSASSVCSVGTGQQRVYAVCEDPQHGTRNTYYGSWVGIGYTSVVSCPTLGGYAWYVVGGSYQTR